MDAFSIKNILIKEVENIPTDRFIEETYFAKKYGYYLEDRGFSEFPMNYNHYPDYYIKNPACPIGAEFISEVWKKMLENKDIYPNFNDAVTPHYGLARIDEDGYYMYEKDNAAFGPSAPDVLWSGNNEISFNLKPISGESSMFKVCLISMYFVPYNDATIISRPHISLSVDYRAGTEGTCTINSSSSEEVNIPVKKGTFIILRYSKEEDDFIFEYIDLNEYAI